MPGALVEALDLAFVRRVGGVSAGEHRGAGVGAGTELAQLRPYQPGDDVRQIDPSATARTGIPHVRQHVPERLLTTWLAVDVSPSMAFGTADRLKSDVAEGVVDVLGAIAVRRGGRVGLLTFGGPSVRVIAPRGGRGARVSLRRALDEGVARGRHRRRAAASWRWSGSAAWRARAASWSWRPTSPAPPTGRGRWPRWRRATP